MLHDKNDVENVVVWTRGDTNAISKPESLVSRISKVAHAFVAQPVSGGSVKRNRLAVKNGKDPNTLCYNETGPVW